MILAIDQGTTGTTCIVFGEDGRERGRSYREFEQHFPKPGWVEHDAAEIWEVTRGVAIGALADAAAQGSDLVGIGITNQRETVVAWDPKTGEPVHRALVWQDRRTAARCDQLREQGHERLVRERTGLVIDPYFSGTKIEWLIQNADLPAGTVFGTIDSWLAFKLTGRHLLDYSNASRTMLFDIRKLAWDAELCDLLGVDSGSLRSRCLGEVYGTTSVFGARSRSPGSRAISRRPCSARPASGRGRRRTPMAPAASSCRTPVPTRPSPVRACSPPWPGAFKGRSTTPSRRRCS
jgi:glycerol kinase